MMQTSRILPPRRSIGTLLLLLTATTESFRVGSPNSRPLSQWKATPLSNQQPPAPLLSTRRAWVQSTVGLGLIGTVAASKGVLSNSRSSTVTTATIAEAVEWIQSNCDARFLQSVVASDYRFLYRGVDTNDIRVQSPTPDLLDVDTYGDPAAVRYFERLEDLLKSEAVQPSHGHLCTTSQADAAQWGTTTASVWPIQDSHYAWLVDGGTFYPPQRQQLQRASVVVDGRDCGVEALEDALRKEGSEVMVATKQWLLVPSAMDAPLRKALQSSFLI